MLLERVLEGAVDDARLDRGRLLDGVDVEDPVHLRDVQQQRAVDAVGSAGQAGERALRDDRQPVLVGEAQGLLDVLDAAGADEGAGPPGRGEQIGRAHV